MPPQADHGGATLDSGPDSGPDSGLGSLVGLVALGGALGGLLRWVLTELFPDPVGVPWTTWWINLTGTAALAALPVLLAGLRERRRRQRLAALLGPGFLGGYTTLSAYALLTRDSLADGALAPVAVMLLGTLAASLVAVHLVRRWELGR